MEGQDKDSTLTEVAILKMTATFFHLVLPSKRKKKNTSTSSIARLIFFGFPFFIFLSLNWNTCAEKANKAPKVDLGWFSTHSHHHIGYAVNRKEGIRGQEERWAAKLSLSLCQSYIQYFLRPRRVLRPRLDSYLKAASTLKLQQALKLQIGTETNLRLQTEC